MSSLGGAGESFSGDKRRTDQNPIRTKSFEIPTTRVQITLPFVVFQRSAWGNIQSKHFATAEDALNVLERADDDMLASVEVAEHYFEVIDHLKTKLNKVDAKLWRRFLLAGPRIQNDLSEPQLSCGRTDLTYANLLFSAGCLCEAEEYPTNNTKTDRLREAAFISCAHSLTALSENYDFINSTGALPSVLVEGRLDDLIHESRGSYRLQMALSEVIESFGNALEKFEQLKKENGTLADHLYNLSTANIVSAQQTTLRNYKLLRSIQDLITDRVSPQVWSSPDEIAQNLVSLGGAHLSCRPEIIYHDSDVRTAALGILREVNRGVEHTILVGKEWVSLFASFDPEKRTPIQVANIINFWLSDDKPDTESSLIRELKIPVNSQQMDNAYTFFRTLRNHQRTGTSIVKLEVDEKFTSRFADDARILIAGPNGYGNLLKSRHTSLLLTTTKPEKTIDLSEVLTTDLANRYLPVAVAAVANQYRCGPWKSSYIPGPILYQVQSEIKWTFPNVKLDAYHRSTFPNGEQDPAVHFHDHYIFVHKNEEDRSRNRRSTRPTQLINA